MMIRLLLSLFFLTSLVRAATVRGLIVGPDEKPVAGATIWAAATGLYQYSEKDNTLQRLISDEKGAFAFEIPDDSFALARVQSAGFAVRDEVLKSGDNKIALQVAKGVNGLVQDKKGQPVAKARVRLSSAFAFNYVQDDLGSDIKNLLSSLAFGESLPPIETRSDGEGKWELPTVNEGYILLDDERFAWNIKGVMPTTASETFVAEVGASLQGQLLTAEGKPIADAYIDGKGLFVMPPRTDSEGRFFLKNLQTESYNLSAIAPDSDWLIPWLKVAPLKAGEINQAPPWRATRGIEVTGQVVDKNGGAPLAGLKILNVVTDAEGRFRVRVIPQQASLSINDSRYMEIQKELEIPFGATTFDAGKFELQRATTIQGVVLDEGGAPLKNEALGVIYQTGRGPTQTPVYADAQGQFTAKVPLGAISLVINRGFFNSGIERELTPDKEVKITATENMAPLRLVAKILPVVPVTGRLVSIARQPIANVKVSIRAMTPSADGQGGGYQYKSAQTDAEGRFSVAFLPGFKDLELYGVSKPNHQLKTPGKATKQKDGWEFSDSVLSALDAKISGRVVNYKGEPLAGALVQWAENPKFAPLQTDAAGRFQLEDLPQDDFKLLAAQGNNFGIVTAKVGDEIEIKVAGPLRMTSTMRQQFFEQLIQGNFYDLTNYWEAIGTEKLLALALQFDGALPPNEFDVNKADWTKAGDAVSWLLLVADRYEIEWLLTDGWEIFQRISPDNKAKYLSNVEKQMATLAGWRGTKAQRDWANKWLDEQLKIKDKANDPQENAARWFSLAGIAGALNRADAKEITLTALTWADQTDAKKLDSNAYSWGGALSYGGPEVFALLENEWPLSARMNALFSAVAYTSNRDLERGQFFLDKAMALNDKIEKKTENDKTNDKNQAQTTQWQWRTAQTKHEPLAVLEWLEKAAPDDWRLRGAIAQALIKRGDFDNARRALQAALDPRFEQPKPSAPQPLRGAKWYFSYFGALAKPFDADLSKKLFAKSQEAINLPDFSSNRADYDYYWAYEDAARTRLWVEYVVQQAQKGLKNDWRPQPEFFASDIAPVDVLRAMEIIGNAPGAPNSKSQMRAKIAAFLLADQASRPTLRSQNEF